MSFSQEIIQWYHIHKRSLPWRATKDPYKIWLSEVILQQTRVAQGTPYYLSFIKHFPTVFDLAAAKEEEVLKLWQGLGYYSRARNLHAAAQQVVSEHGGVFPKDYKGLLNLKGVGDYTASAIASICYHQPEAVLDGNVFRVLSRYLGLEVPINSSLGAKLFKLKAKELCDLNNPSDYNQGIMEFGALQCVPQSPSCGTCPLSASCVAFQTNQVDKLPVKTPKKKPQKIQHHYVVLLDPYGNTSYMKRVGKGIWEGLYEFPLIVSEGSLKEQELFEKAQTEFVSLPISKVESLSLYNQDPVVHKLTHRHIDAFFWVGKVSASVPEGLSFNDLEKYPTSVLISDFIKAFKNSYF